MGEDRHVVVSQPMKDFDRFFDLEPARHEQECSRRNERLVQRSELSRTKCRFSGHEIFPEEIGVLHQCELQWLKIRAAQWSSPREYFKTFLRSSSESGALILNGARSITATLENRQA